jgi:hypothetical protein
MGIVDFHHRERGIISQIDGSSAKRTIERSLKNGRFPIESGHKCI